MKYVRYFFSESNLLHFIHDNCTNTNENMLKNLNVSMEPKQGCGLLWFALLNLPFSLGNDTKESLPSKFTIEFGKLHKRE